MENDKCLICNDETRDKSTLIVVSSFKDVLSLERLNSLHASYHILNGTISPTKGISASDINIEKLLKRIENSNIQEVILATNPTIDGETTALYISKLLISLFPLLPLYIVINTWISFIFLPLANVFL